MIKEVHDITNALKNIKETGNFYATRRISTDKLQISIKSFGTLKFPLKPQNVQGLIKFATAAKFGWRNQTLLDLREGKKCLGNF